MRFEYTLENFDTKFNNQGKQMELIKDFVTNTKKHLIIMSSVGTGKTHIAKVLRMELTKHGKDFNKNWTNSYAQFLTAYELHLFYNRWKDKDGVMEGTTMRDLTSSRGIIIDDLGNEPEGYKLEGAFLQNLLDSFFGKVVITTNLNAKQIKEQYGERIYSRLCFNSEWINFSGLNKDYRRK